MATPHVSGVAALVIAKFGDIGPDNVRQKLQDTAEDHGTAGWDKYYGWGIVDAYKALNQLPHTVTITIGPTANPSTIDSGGTTNLSVTATDSLGHSINYSWTVSPNEGSFSNPNTQNPTWTAPENCTDADKIYTFTATAACSEIPSVKDTGTVQVTVRPKPHTVTITSATANPAIIDSSGTTSLSALATDSCGHNINFSWTVSPNEGSFSNPFAQNPIWIPPPNYTCAAKTYTVIVTVTCSVDPNIKDTKTVQVIVRPAYDIVLKDIVINTTAVFCAINSITAGPSVVIVPPGDVTFRAGNIIKLEPGFEAKPGSKFHAVIDPGLRNITTSEVLASPIMDVKATIKNNNQSLQNIDN